MESLPAEVIWLIAKQLDHDDLIAFHATSDWLNTGSDPVFVNEFFRSIFVDVTLGGLQKLHQVSQLDKLKTNADSVSISIQNIPQHVGGSDMYEGDYISLDPDPKIKNAFHQIQSEPEYLDALNMQNWLLDSGRFALDLTACLSSLSRCVKVELSDASIFERHDCGIESICRRDGMKGTLTRPSDMSMAFCDEKPRWPGGIAHARYFSSYQDKPGSRKFIATLMRQVLVAISRSTHTIKTLEVASFWEYGIHIEDLPPTLHHSDVCSLQKLYLDLVDDGISTLHTHEKRRCIDNFFQRFDTVTKLGLWHRDEPGCLSDYLNILRIEALQKISLLNVICRPADLSILMQPNQWERLEKLELGVINIKDELKAWSRFLQWLEQRTNLRKVLLEDCLSMDVEIVLDFEEVCHPCLKLVERDVGGSWHGKLSEVAKQVKLKTSLKSS